MDSLDHGKASHVDILWSFGACFAITIVLLVILNARHQTDLVEFAASHNLKGSGSAVIIDLHQ